MKISILVTAFLGSGSRTNHPHVHTTQSTCTVHLLPTAAAGEISVSIPPAIQDSVAIVRRDPFLIHHKNDISTMTPWMQGIREWLVPSALAATDSISPPTSEEIKLLREAFATFYGVDRDLEKSEQLLSKAIQAWDRQAPDEKAAS